MEQPLWLQRAIKVGKYHDKQIKANEKWTITLTAQAFRRSIGAICEDLLICSWLKTHEKEISEYKYQKDALEFIRRKRKTQRSDFSHLSEHA